jgi:hypothetical protein
VVEAKPERDGVERAVVEREGVCVAGPHVNLGMTQPCEGDHLLSEIDSSDRRAAPERRTDQRDRPRADVQQRSPPTDTSAVEQRRDRLTGKRLERTGVARRHAPPHLTIVHLQDLGWLGRVAHKAIVATHGGGRIRGDHATGRRAIRAIRGRLRIAPGGDLDPCCGCWSPQPSDP